MKAPKNLRAARGEAPRFVRRLLLPDVHPDRARLGIASAGRVLAVIGSALGLAVLLGTAGCASVATPSIERASSRVTPTDSRGDEVEAPRAPPPRVRVEGAGRRVCESDHATVVLELSERSTWPLEVEVELPALFGDARLTVEAPKHPRLRGAEVLVKSKSNPSAEEVAGRVGTPVSAALDMSRATILNVRVARPKSTGRSPHRACGRRCELRLYVRAAFGGPEALERVFSAAARQQADAGERFAGRSSANASTAAMTDALRRLQRSAPCRIEELEKFALRVSDVAGRLSAAVPDDVNGRSMVGLDADRLRAEWVELFEDIRALPWASEAARSAGFVPLDASPETAHVLESLGRLRAAGLQGEELVRGAFWVQLAMSRDEATFVTRRAGAPPLNSLADAEERLVFMKALAVGTVEIPVPNVPVVLDPSPKKGFRPPASKVCLGDGGLFPVADPAAATHALLAELGLGSGNAWVLETPEQAAEAWKKAAKGRGLFCALKPDLRPLEEHLQKVRRDDGLAALQVELSKLDAIPYRSGEASSGDAMGSGPVDAPEEAEPVRDHTGEEVLPKAPEVAAVVDRVLCEAFSPKGLKLPRRGALVAFAERLERASTLLEHAPHDDGLRCSGKGPTTWETIRKRLEANYRAALSREPGSPLEIARRVQETFELSPEQFARPVEDPKSRLLAFPPPLYLSGQERGWGACQPEFCGEISRLRAEARRNGRASDVVLVPCQGDPQTDVRTVTVRSPGLESDFRLVCRKRPVTLTLDENSGVGRFLVIVSGKPFTVANFKPKKTTHARLGWVYEVSLDLWRAQTFGREAGKKTLTVEPAQSEQAFIVTTRAPSALEP